MLDDTLPPSTQKHLNALHPDSVIRFVQTSDLKHDGTFGPTYLAVKGNHLIALDETGVLLDLPMTEVKEIRIVELLGGSSLIAQLKSGGEQKLVRYTRTLVPEFGVYCRTLNNVLQNIPTPVPESEGAITCARCGNPLPERGATCPACVNFFAVFKRQIGRAHV